MENAPTAAPAETPHSPFLGAITTTEQSATADSAPAQPMPAAVAANEQSAPAEPAKAAAALIGRPTMTAALPTAAAVAGPITLAAAPKAGVTPGLSHEAASVPPPLPAAVTPKPAPAPAPMVVGSAAIASPVPGIALHVPAPPGVAAAPTPVLTRHTAVAPAAAATDAGSIPWLQVAAIRSENDVAYEWHRQQTRLPDLLGGRTLTVSHGETHDHTYWRLRTSGFASLAEANALCLRIRVAGGDCFAFVTSGS
jgi:hypothetical protein